TYGSGNGEFNAPLGVALDGGGNLFVVDYGNNRVQKFTSTGIYLTQWAGFVDPVGAAIDGAGNVYVTQWGNARVRVFTNNGVSITDFGTPGSGPGEFIGPVGVAVDSGRNVYVSDLNNRVQKFAPDVTPVAQKTWGGVKARYRPGAATQEK